MEDYSVFDFLDFKDYLAKRLAPSGSSRGMRITFAKLIHASPSYVSKILSGKIKLSLEHVPVINKLLEHTEQESNFFMKLVLYTQAGSSDLEAHFMQELKIILEQRRVASEWIPGKHELSQEHLAKFHSAWYYIIIHIITSIPEFQTKSSIAQRLKLSLTTVTKTLDYLIQIGMVEKKGDRYRNIQRRIHHPLNSEWLQHDHINMRQLAIQKLVEPDGTDIHYWLVIALSMKNCEIIRRKIRKMVQELEPYIVSEKNEDLYCMVIDYFRV